MRQIRRRFIAAAMSAFLILLILITGSIMCVSYLQMEHDGAAFIENSLRELYNQPLERGKPGGDFHFRQPMAPAVYYEFRLGEDGEVLLKKNHGVVESDEQDMSDVIEGILSENRTSGNYGVYKFGMADSEDGTKLIVLDRSMQLQFLYAVFRGAMTVSAVCLMLMFLILQPISRRVTKTIAAIQERQRQFVTNASHELKTPVAVIRSNIEAMEMIAGETRWSRNIHQQSLRLDHMISQLLLLERMDEKTQRGKMKTVSMEPLVRGILDDMSELLRQRNIRPVTDIQDNLSVKGYEEALSQLIRIMIDNASRYALDDSEMTFSACRIGRNTIIKCANQVEKLPDCSPDALFERFHRGGIQRRTGDVGCGIGLSAAASITAMHHGEITAAYPDEHIFLLTVKLPVKHEYRFLNR